MALNYKNPAIICNPNAMGGKVKLLFDNYYYKLKESNLFNDIAVFVSESKEGAIKAVDTICASKERDLIITVGGDGTISTVVNALMKLDKSKRLPIFPLPSGSGNSLLRDFNVLTLEDAINNYKKAEAPEKFELLFVEEIEGNFKYYCINVLGMGFISDVVVTVLKFNKRFGALSYFIGIFSSLGKFKPYDTKIVYDGGTNEYKSSKVFFLTVSNTKRSGGKILVAPEAHHNDGFMDVVALHDIGRFRFLKGFLKAFRGKRIKDKGRKYIRTDSLEIYASPKFYLMPDGELEGTSPVRVSVIRNEVELIV
jgi:YegS/Rv2252/BmrU family lipid kinase